MVLVSRSLLTSIRNERFSSLNPGPRRYFKLKPPCQFLGALRPAETKIQTCNVKIKCSQSDYNLDWSLGALIF